MHTHVFHESHPTSPKSWGGGGGVMPVCKYAEGVGTSVSSYIFCVFFSKQNQLSAVCIMYVTYTAYMHLLYKSSLLANPRV